MKHALITLFHLVLFHSYHSLQAQTYVHETELVQLMSQFVKDDAPGMAVGIVHNGEIVFEKSLGYANLENKIPISSETRFNIASNAKQFTAICLLQLIQAGEIALEDPVSNYLPSYFEEYSGVLKVKHLLSHTSGIRDVYDLWALQGKTWWQLFVGNQEALSLLNDQTALNFPPGTEYLYSNSNYILITELIKKVTGRPFSDYSQAFFSSIGMYETGFLTNYMELVPNKALHYGNWEGWKAYPFITETHGDGALFTSLKDQLKWEMLIQSLDSHDSLAQLLEESQQLISGSGTSQYGYGLFFGEFEGMATTYHDGSTGAYNASFIRFPKHKLSIVIMSNSANVPTRHLAEQMAKIYVDLKEEVNIYPAGPERIMELSDPEKLVGDYLSSTGSIVHIRLKSDTLYRDIYQYEAVALLPEEGGLFHYASNGDLKISFDEDDEGQLQFTLYLASQAPIVAKKLPSYTLDKSYFAVIEGDYINKETKTTIHLAHLEDNRFQLIKNGKEREAVLDYKDLLRFNNYEVRIMRGDSQKVNALSIDQGRIKNVLFEKMK